MTTNQAVAEAWVAGRYAQSQSMHTNGRSIWSYDLMIGHIGPDHRIFVRNARAPGRYNPGGRFYSMTTSSKHMPPVIYAAYRAADKFGHTVTIVPDADFDREAFHVGRWADQAVEGEGK